MSEPTNTGRSMDRRLKDVAGLSAGALLVDLVRASLARSAGGTTIMVGGVTLRLSESDAEL
jgi:hypothetical protein